MPDPTAPHVGFALPPSRSAVAALLLNAVLSTVLPDMLLAQAPLSPPPIAAHCRRQPPCTAVPLLFNESIFTVQAVMMTSPLLATLGLSTMIPLSVLTDYARGLASDLSPGFYVGSLGVFIGFLLENYAENYAEGTERAESDGGSDRRSDPPEKGGVLLRTPAVRASAGDTVPAVPDSATPSGKFVPACVPDTPGTLLASPAPRIAAECCGGTAAAPPGRDFSKHQA